MGVLSAITSSALSIISQSREDKALVDAVNQQYRPTISFEDPRKIGKKTSEIIDLKAPKNIDFFEESSTYFVQAYQRASYYFYNCSIENTVIRKIPQEALRNGLELIPKFQVKCPECGEEYDNTVKKCKVCGYDGVMKKPDYTQRKLLVNWRGNSILDEVNRNGWTLQDLCSSYTILTLVYNQPLILCKSLYAVDEHGNALDEIPQEFVPLSPTKVRYLFDDTGTPGNGKGFTLRDRQTVCGMMDGNDPQEFGWHEGQRLYPARWCASSADGGWDSGCTYYANEEVFHKVYSVPSMTYGTPICSLIEYAIRAWIALEMRVEKYYNTGHPQGIFAISGITPTQLDTIQQSIRNQMADDPYQMPMMGIPPGGGDTVKTAKWFQLADNPTGDMMQVKAELQQRIASAYGVSGLFLGDVHSIKGNSNEQQQMAVMDRNLIDIRNHINCLLKWIVSKYKGVTDWIIRIVEPADEQTRKKSEDLNKELINGQLAQQLGIPITSFTDGKLEYGDVPINIPQLESMAGGTNGPNANQRNAGVSLNEQESHLFGTDIGDSSQIGGQMMRGVNNRENGGMDKTKSLKITSQQLGDVITRLLQNGVELI